MDSSLTADWVEPRIGEEDGAVWWRQNRRLVLIAGLLCALCSALAGLLYDSPFLGIGPDPDDAMRVAQLRDLLNGQNWFDTAQHRLGMDGTAMHWSRLSDLPFILIAGALKPFVGTNMAVAISGSIVPGLAAILFALGLMRGISALSGRATLPVIAAGVVTMMILAFPPRFAFGAFDHHHFQIALMAVATGYSLIRQPSWRDGLIAGLACVGSVVIGLEGAPIIAGICVVWALRWVWRDDVERATSAFGAALVGGSVMGLTLFSGSALWQGVICDAFGWPLAGLLVAGGGALWLAAGRAETKLVKLGTLAVAGAIGLGAVVIAAPQCLGNPMDQLPVTVQEGWLAQVSEARPFTAPTFTMGERAAFLASPLIALLIAGWVALRRRAASWLILASIIACGIIFTLYQVRFYTFATVAAAFVMGTLLLRVLEWQERADGRPVGPLLRMPVLLLTLLASSPIALGLLAGAALDPKLEGAAADYDAIAMTAECNDPKVMSALSNAPQGRIWSGLDVAPSLLLGTPHTPIAGNYHRGARDIARWLEIAAMPPQEARQILAATNVSHVLFCDMGVSEIVYADLYPTGFVNALSKERPPAGLDLIGTPVPGVRIYEVTE